MSPAGDAPDEGLPDGWASEEESDDVRSWLGPDGRVVCTRQTDGWVAYAEPRDEIGAGRQVPLTDGPTDEDRAHAAAIEYMGASDGET